MFENYEDILNIEEVSEALRIGTSQTYRIVRSGQLKAYKEGRDWKIPKSSLQDYIQNKIAQI